MTWLTNKTIKRRRCYRCGVTGHSQWSICADGNKVRVLCKKCDKTLNRWVLRWMKDPKWREKCERYERKV